MKSNKLPGSFGLLWDLQDSYLGELPSPANKYKHIVIENQPYHGAFYINF